LEGKGFGGNVEASLKFLFSLVSPEVTRMGPEKKSTGNKIIDFKLGGIHEDSVGF
jgi:hypothetical protein